MNVERGQNGVSIQAGVSDDAAFAPDLSAQRQSLVRLKAGAAFMVFLSCWLFLRYVSGNSAIAFGIAGVSAVSVWFIRCERCHSSI
jgi:uncharacterized membrane protein